MAAKYTAEHPAMREINGQLAAINKQIGELNSTLKQLPDVQRQYLQLYREVEVKHSSQRSTRTNNFVSPKQVK